MKNMPNSIGELVTVISPGITLQISDIREYMLVNWSDLNIQDSSECTNHIE